MIKNTGICSCLLYGICEYFMEWCMMKDVSFSVLQRPAIKSRSLVSLTVFMTFSKVRVSIRHISIQIENTKWKEKRKEYSKWNGTCEWRINSESKSSFDYSIGDDCNET